MLLIAFPSFYFAGVGLIFSYVGHIASAILDTFTYPLITFPSKCRNIVQYSSKRQIHLDLVSIWTICRKLLHQILHQNGAILYSILQADLYDIWTFLSSLSMFLLRSKANLKHNSLKSILWVFLSEGRSIALMLSSSIKQS